MGGAAIYPALDPDDQQAEVEEVPDAFSGDVARLKREAGS
jgi:hypothetical protein